MKALLAEGAWKTSWVPITLLLLLLPLRWIFIAGLGDFPNDFSFSFRLAIGQRQGVDFAYFYSTALPFYLSALWFQLFGGHFLGLNANIWLWWLANSIASGWLIRRMGGTADQATFGAGTVALLFFPPNMNLTSWHFIASVLSTAAVGMALAPDDGSSDRSMFASGALCGVNSMVKANIGVGTFGAIAVAILARRWVAGKRVSRGRMGIAPFAVGFLVGLGVPLMILGHLGGYWEIVSQGFFSSGPTKGGPLPWLLRSFPRISLALDPPRKYFVEMAIALPLFWVFFGLLWRIWGKRFETSAPSTASPGERHLSACSWLLFGTAIAMSVWSLFPASFPGRLQALLRRMAIDNIAVFNSHLLYVFVFAALSSFLLFHLHRMARQGMGRYREGFLGSRPDFTFGGVVLLCLMSNGAAGRYGAAYSASLFVPFLILALRGRFEKRFAKVLTAAVIIWTVSWHVSPGWPSTFGHLTRLPEGSIFSGMYHPSHVSAPDKSYRNFESAEVFAELQENLPGKIAGKTTLWIGATLEGAFREIPYRYGLVQMSPGHPPERERRLVESLHRNKPDYIIISDVLLWDKSSRSSPGSFFRSESFLPWLKKNYVRIWEGSSVSPPFQLWESRR